MALSPRDRRALIGGGALIALMLLYLALRSGGEAPPASPDRNLVSDVPATMPAAPMVDPPAAAPPVTAAAPSADLSQLHLVGLLSSGAVIVMADGNQRFVPLGRDVLPGLRLLRVETHEAVLSGGAGEVRLGFDAAPQVQPAPAVAPRP